MKIKRKEEAKMKPESVQVAVRIVGEGLEGKMKGKTVYQMYDSVEVMEARPNEVFDVIVRALEAASQSRK